MRKLHNLDSIVLGSCVLRKAYERRADGTPHEGGEILLCGLQHALRRITSFAVECVRDSLLVSVLRDVDPARLRQLRVMDDLFACPMSEDLVAAIDSLTVLEELRLDGTSLASFERTWPPLKLRPACKLVLFNTTNTDTYGDSLVLAHQIAPSLSSLTIKFPPWYSYERVSPTPANATPLLPNLRTLFLDGICSALHPHFDKSQLAALEHLQLSVPEPAADFPWVYIPSESTSLRRITTSFAVLDPCPVAPELREECADLGLHLVLHRRPVPAPSYQPNNVRRAERESMSDYNRGELLVRVLDETLEWARQRVQALVRADDEEGLDELCQAAMRRRERQLLRERAAQWGRAGRGGVAEGDRRRSRPGRAGARLGQAP